MTRTKTFTQTPQIIAENQQSTDTHTFAELLQTYITSSPPPFQDTNRLAVEVVPRANPVSCADSDLASASPSLASASVIASQPLTHDPAPALVPTSVSGVNPTNPFTIYQQPLATITPQPVQWLWQHRLPLAGITLLDGDHGCGKTLLAYQIAASVSSGSPMPDGTPTIQGGEYPSS